MWAPSPSHVNLSPPLPRRNPHGVGAARPQASTQSNSSTGNYHPTAPAFSTAKGYWWAAGDTAPTGSPHVPFGTWSGTWFKIGTTTRNGSSTGLWVWYPIPAGQYCIVSSNKNGYYIGIWSSARPPAFPSGSKITSSWTQTAPGYWSAFGNPTTALIPQGLAGIKGLGQTTPPVGIAGGSLAAIQAAIVSVGGTVVPSTTTMTCSNFVQIATPGGASGGSGAMGWSAPANQPVTPGVPTSSALWQQGPTASTFQQFAEQYAQLGPAAPIIHFTVGPNLFKLRVYQGIPQLEVCAGPWTGGAAPAAASSTNWLLWGAVGVVVVGGLVYAAG